MIDREKKSRIVKMMVSGIVGTNECLCRSIFNINANVTYA